MDSLISRFPLTKICPARVVVSFDTLISASSRFNQSPERILSASRKNITTREIYLIFAREEK